MNERKTLNGYIRKAKWSLMYEKIVPIFQYCIFAMLVICTLVFIVSRLFVFPYYRNVAIILAVVVLVLTIVYIGLQRVRQKEAMMKLDAYYPNNELVTSLSLDDNNPLVKSLLQKAVVSSPISYEKFKERKKDLWRTPILISILLTSIFLGLLISFPSQTQKEAVSIEKEKEIINDVKKEITTLEKKLKNKENKRQLQQLKNKLKEVDSAEKALREVVKKQKELKLLEQKLQQQNLQKKGANGEGLSKEQKRQLQELAKMQNDLNKNVQNTKSQLSKFGKPISKDLQNEIASLETDSNSGNRNNQNNQSNQNKKSNQNKQGNQNNRNDNQNKGNGYGNGNGNGNSNGNGNGNGGRGGGKSNGKGNGTGSGAGLGQGSRELLSIPKRIGKMEDITVDGGPLGSGESKQQKGAVHATKGTVVPYEEVISEYKNSYFESSERLQLPKDLQAIVQSYFSSIEDE